MKALKTQRNERGVFFTTDAVLSLALVALIIGAAFSLFGAQQNSGAAKSIMDMNASDNAMKSYLKGSTIPIETVPLTSEKKQASCAELFNYNSDPLAGNPKITVAVRKCKWPT